MRRILFVVLPFLLCSIAEATPSNLGQPIADVPITAGGGESQYPVYSGSLQSGKYYALILNGQQLMYLRNYPDPPLINQPVPLINQQCEVYALYDQKRQCQYVNLVENWDKTLTRILKGTIVVNGNKIKPDPAITNSRAVSIIPFTIQSPAGNVPMNVGIDFYGTQPYGVWGLGPQNYPGSVWMTAEVQIYDHPVGPYAIFSASAQCSFSLHW